MAPLGGHPNFLKNLTGRIDRVFTFSQMAKLELGRAYRLFRLMFIGRTDHIFF